MSNMYSIGSMWATAATPLPSARATCTADELRSGDGGRWLARSGDFPYYLTRDVWDKIGLVRIKAAPKRAPHNCE